MGRLKLRLTKRPIGHATRVLALPCGGPASCTLSAEVPFTAFRDDTSLVRALMSVGWVLSVVTAEDNGHKTTALMPLCRGCAKIIHGEKLVEAASEAVGE